MASSNVESRITRAVTSAVEDHMTNGTHPDVAIAKVAQDQGLSIPMTERAVEVFNQAKTRVFLKSAEDKTASFPVADSRKAIKLAFGQGLTSKTASREEVPFSYSFKPYTAHTQKDAEAGPILTGIGNLVSKGMDAVESAKAGVGAAKDKVWNGVRDTVKGVIAPNPGGVPDKFIGVPERELTPKAPAPAPKKAEWGDDPDRKVLPAEVNMMRERAIHSLKCASEEARMDATRAFDLCQDAFAHASKLAASTSQWDDTIVECRSEGTSPTMEWVISKVAELSNREVPTEGESGYAASEIDTDLLDSLREVHSHLKVASLSEGASKRALEMAEYLFTVQKEAATIPQGVGPDTKPKGKDKPDTKPKGSTSDAELLKGYQGIVDDITPQNRRESGIRSSIDGIYGDAAKWRFEKTRGQHHGGVAKLSPEEEGEQMARQRVLLHLIHSDEILSAADPAEVVKHYNTLIKVAPEVSLIPEAARGFLRNMVHSNGGIDLFSVEQAGKAESGLRTARVPGEISSNPAMKEIREKQMMGAR